MARLLCARNVTRAVFVTFVAATIYVMAGVVFASSAVPSEMTGRVKFDYFVLLLQCVFALVALMAPEYISRKAKISIPSAMTMVYSIFIFAGILCGSILDFYNIVPHFDTLLHFFSGVLLCALGFSLVGSFNKSGGVSLATNRFFAAMFALCFAVTLGVVWEIAELALDSALGINAQRYLAPSGAPLVGQAALMDTMKDLMFDGIGAAVFAFYGYNSLSLKNSPLENLTIRRLEK